MKTLTRKKAGEVVTVKLTPKHIAVGKPCNSVGCPLALAIQEATGIPEVLVGPRSFRDDDTWIAEAFDADTQKIWEAELPPKVGAKAASFDGGDTLSPMTFKLRLHRTK